MRYAIEALENVIRSDKRELNLALREIRKVEKQSIKHDDNPKLHRLKNYVRTRQNIVNEKYEELDKLKVLEREQKSRINRYSES